MRNKLFLFVFLFAVLAIVDSHAFERKKYNFNSEWRLQIGDFPEAKQSQFDDSRWKAVTLPHAFNEDEAFKVSIEQLTDTVVWYRKHFRIPASGKKQKVFIEFEGVRCAYPFIWITRSFNHILPSANRVLRKPVRVLTSSKT